MMLSTLLLIGIVGEHAWIAGYSKESVYIFASVVGVVGFVMQDVVADTMSTEVVDQTQSEDAIKTAGYYTSFVSTLFRAGGFYYGLARRRTL
jgi:hypothetical protein